MLDSHKCSRTHIRPLELKDQGKKFRTSETWTLKVGTHRPPRRSRQQGLGSHSERLCDAGGQTPRREAGRAGAGSQGTQRAWLWETAGVTSSAPSRMTRHADVQRRSWGTLTGREASGRQVRLPPPRPASRLPPASLLAEPAERADT